MYLPELERYLLGIRKQNQKTDPVRVLLGESKFWTQAHPSDCAGHSLPRPAFYGPGLCRCCEATLREPLLRDGSGFDRLRPNDQENPDRGFYLITLKGSKQAGLTGLEGRHR